MSEARARKQTHMGSTVFGQPSELLRRSASTLEINKSLKSLNRFERPTSTLRNSTFASQRYHERSSVLDGVTEKASLKRDSSFTMGESSPASSSLNKSFADFKTVSKTISCKPKDTRNILGNERSDFSKTSVNRYIKGPDKEFQPRYAETSALSRKQTEFHGQLVEKIPETSEK